MDQDFEEGDGFSLGQNSGEHEIDDNRSVRSNNNDGEGQNPDIAGYVRFEDFEEIRRRLQEEMTRNDELRRERLMINRNERNLHDDFRNGRIVDARGNEARERNVERDIERGNGERNTFFSLLSLKDILVKQAWVESCRIKKT